MNDTHFESRFVRASKKHLSRAGCAPESFRAFASCFGATRDFAVRSYSTKQNVGSRIFLAFSSLYGSDYHGSGEVCQAHDVLLQRQLK